MVQKRKFFLTMDPLFQQIELWQGEQNWGHVLDAGTGEHSLRWILGQITSSVTAITGDQQRKEALSRQFQNQLRANDQIEVGNWLNQSLLENQCFDIVIADYLLGALEGFSPYFQSSIFGRLRSHCKNNLYVIGQEPLPNAFSKGGELIRQLYQLRDSCILLAGHKCYREYPQRWVLDNLQHHNFQIIASQHFGMSLGSSFVRSQIQVCQSKLRYFQSKSLAREMSIHIEEIKYSLLDYIENQGPISFGEDYVIHARPL